MFTAPRRQVSRVFIHCSANDETRYSGKRLVETVRKWHLARGFSDVGYHYLIDKGGAVLSGRSLEKVPAAQRGHNTGSIAICVHGLAFSDDWCESVQAEALRKLCLEIHHAYSGIVGFWPHNAVANKSCPVFDIEDVLDLDRWRRLA